MQFEYPLFVCINYVQTLICFSLGSRPSISISVAALNDNTHTHTHITGQRVKFRPSFSRYSRKRQEHKKKKPLASRAGRYMVDKARAGLIARYSGQNCMRKVIGAKDFWPSFNKTRGEHNRVHAQPLAFSLEKRIKRTRKCVK